jgi:hypothetical protein
MPYKSFLFELPHPYGLPAQKGMSLVSTKRKSAHIMYQMAKKKSSLEGPEHTKTKVCRVYTAVPDNTL